MSRLIFILFIFLAGLGTGFYLSGLEESHVTQKITDIVKNVPTIPGIKEDAHTNPLTAADITSGLIGEWQSIDDPKFMRVFSIDSSVVDAYAGDSSSRVEGTWAVFIAPQGEPPPFPVPPGTVYLKISSIEEVLYFKVLTVTPETLELMYLDGGGVQKFVKKK